MTGNSDADFFGPIFLMALPGFIVFRASNREGRFWVSALLGIWLAWWPFTAMGRFFLPGLALFSAWIGLALCRLPGVWVRGAVMTTVAIVCLNNTMWLAALAGPIRAWDYLLGKETREAFLRAPRSTYPTPSFSAMNWINHHAPSESRVLVEGDARGFYLARPFLASSIFDTNLFAKWVKESGSPSDLLKRFQAERVNYLLVNMGEIMRLNRATPLSHRDLDVAEAFLQEYTDELFSDLNQKQEEFRWAIVYGISGERRKPREEPPPLVSFYRRQIAKNEAG
jgi:hypothetical protein